MHDVTVPGAYSLIQYCPRPERDERLNIGAVFVSTLPVSVLRLTDDEIRAVLVRMGIRPSSLRFVIQDFEALADRLHRVGSVDELRGFVEQEVGHIRLGNVRSIWDVYQLESRKRVMDRLVRSEGSIEACPPPSAPPSPGTDPSAGSPRT